MNEVLADICVFELSFLQHGRLVRVDLRGVFCEVCEIDFDRIADGAVE